jgi:tRNA (guanosine-2'-O-)-methyltransferase
LTQLSPRTADALIGHLLQFVTPEKQARMETVLASRTSRLQVVLEDIFQPHNASAVMRSCECFGIQHLHVIENRYAYTLNREVAMGSSNWINLHRYRRPEADNSGECLEHLREQGFQIVATSLNPGSIPLDELPMEEKTAIWFGTEEDGLSNPVLEAADTHVHIPMRGFTQSFNISVSAAICLYELRTRLQRARPEDWALTPSERQEVLLLWLRNSVRNVEIIERNFLKAIGGQA